MIPAGSSSVMNSRREPPDSLDFFPTPPWATRSFLNVVLPVAAPGFAVGSVCEPACGEGHMCEVMRETIPDVRASDVWDYGKGYPVLDFLDARKPVAPAALGMTNPPFNAALAFAMRLLTVAPVVAIIVRTGWAHGEDRYRDLFATRPPTLVAYSAERIPMHRGRWEPKGSTATDYAWFIWVDGAERLPPFWIPPGQKRAFSRLDDVRRFAIASDTPLFAE